MVRDTGGFLGVMTNFAFAEENNLILAEETYILAPGRIIGHLTCAKGDAK
jgi:hypothetical protein